MSHEHKNFHRSTTADNSVIDSELAKLLAANYDDYNVIVELTKKYGDDRKLIDAIYDAYKIRMKTLTKYAQKFKELFLAKYGSLNLSTGDMIKKAKKFARRNKISDDQFNAFVKMIMDPSYYKQGFNNFYGIANTPIAKTLGFQSVDINATELNYPPTESTVLNDIVNMETANKLLHNQVILQGMLFVDCAYQMFAGMTKFDHYKKNAYNFIHPILFAMFAHKINIFDECILYSSIGNLIKTKYNRQKIQTKPDHELYWNLVHDPSESVCNSSSALQDLKNRFELQVKIWENVLCLRQGMYYDNVCVGFADAIDKCENKVFDFPDLALIQDEGTMMKKILAAFGLRPTIVATSVINSNVMGFSNNLLGRDPFVNAASVNLTNLTTIPMLTLRLPLSIVKRNNANVPQTIHLEDTFTQIQWFLNVSTDKSIVPKTQSIIHTNDVLVFYVVRRYQTFSLDRIGIRCNFTSLPMTMSGFEAVNDYPVEFDHNISIIQDTYKLASVVCVECDPNTKIIVGCVAAIVVPTDISLNRYDDVCLLYDPIGASVVRLDANGNRYREAPIVSINKYSVNMPQMQLGPINYTESLEEKAKKSGTLFIYRKVSNGIC